MRALVVTLSLAMIVAFSVALLVLFGGVRVNQAMLVNLGLGLFLFAGLFAAISALGPKYDPTPALTPIMAGTVATAFASVMVIFANHQTIPARGALSIEEPATAETPAPEIPAARQVEADPEPAAPPTPGLSSDFATPLSSGDPLPGLDIAPQDSVTAALPSEPTPESLPDLAPTSPSSIPVPVPRPSPDTPGAVSPTGPGASSSGTPMPLTFTEDSFDSATSSAAPAEAPAAASPSRPGTVTPPLPRSRPCGAGGPPCL